MKFTLKIYLKLVLVLGSSSFTGSVHSQKHGCESLSFRTGVDISCEHPVTKESLDCQKMQMPVGTVAKYKCEEFFVTNDGETEGGQMTCGKNGKWTPDLRFRSFACHMECGKSYPDSAHTYWPWHAGIFARESLSTPDNFKFACGGTLINPFNADELLVLTGAECIRNRNPADIQIRLGLFSLDKNTHNEHSGQTISVQKIVTEDDGLLALIQLTREPFLSKSVLPACLSLSVDFAKHQIQESAFGQLVGFGDQSSSDALRNISAGVVTLGNCMDKRTRIISKHSFCAGGDKGPTICDGDFGSGLLFPRFQANSERHFILGVLGESLRKCKSHSWFIGVNDYADWIKQTALELHESRAQGHVEPKLAPLLPTVLPQISDPRTSPPMRLTIPQIQTPPPTVQVQTPSPPTVQIRTPPPTVQVQTPSPPTVQNRTPPPTGQIRTPPPTVQVQTPSPPTVQIRTPPPTVQVRTPSPPTVENRTPPPTVRIRTPPPTAQIRTPPPTTQIQTSRPPTPTSSEIEIDEVDDLASLPIPIRDIIQGIIRTHSPAEVVAVEMPEDNLAASSMTDYEATAVQQHNVFRRRHGVPPVKISHELSQLAQSEAEQALAINQFKFQGFTNWYGISGKPMTFTRLTHDAVRDWYKTSANYTWSHPRPNSFTQVIWKSTTAIGVGIAQRGKKQIVVVKYARPAVISSEREQAMLDNVLRPISKK